MRGAAQLRFGAYVTRAAVRQRRGTAVVQASTVIIGVGPCGIVVDDAVVQRAVIGPAAVGVGPVAGQGAVVQRAIIGPAAAVVSKVAGQRAAVQCAGIGPAASILSRVAGQRAVVQRAPIRPAAAGLPARGRVARQHTVRHHRAGRLTPHPAATVCNSVGQGEP